MEVVIEDARGRRCGGIGGAHSRHAHRREDPRALPRRDEAEEMILKLSTFFRSSLSLDPSADVTLAEEIALQSLYLDRYPNIAVAEELPRLPEG